MRIFCGIVSLDFSPVRGRVRAAYEALEDYELRSAGPFVLVFDPVRPAFCESVDSRTVIGDRNLHRIDSRDQRTEIHSLCDLTTEELGPSLHGEFALAMSDARERSITLVRDRLGIRPLYWTVVDGDLVFGSVASLVARHPAYRFGVDRYGVALAILEGNGDPSRTAWEGISRLPPASRVIWRDSRKGPVEDYWTLETRQVRMSEEEATEGFRLALARAIRRRFVPSSTGALLSGGLDSSSVVCVAAEEGLDVPTYTLRFPDHPAADEGAYVEKVVRKYALRNTQVPVAADRVADTWQEDGWSGSPDLFYYPNLQMLEPLLEEARSDGVAVLLDGLGGDHLLHATIAPLDLIAANLRRGRLGLAWRAACEWRRIEGVSPLRGLMRLALRRLFPPIFRFVWAKWKRQFPAGYVGTGLALKHRIWSDLYPWRRPALTDQTRESTRETICSRSHFERWFEQNHLLANCRGIDLASPFADVDLVEYVLSVPPDVLFDPYEPRRLQRAAMDGILPEEIRTRSDKGDFDGLIGEVLRSRLLRGAGRYLDRREVQAAKLIADSATVRRWMDQIEEGAVDWNIPLFMETLNYEQWLRFIRAGVVYRCDWS